MTLAWAHSLKGWINVLSALFAIAAAVLWIKSANVQVWADGQLGPKGTNMVMWKNGRLFDVTGTAEAQSRWSAWAAYAAAATLQALAAFLTD